VHEEAQGVLVIGHGGETSVPREMKLNASMNRR
jgi:hypothetical protein